LLQGAGTALTDASWCVARRSWCCDSRRWCPPRVPPLIPA